MSAVFCIVLLKSCDTHKGMEHKGGCNQWPAVSLLCDGMGQREQSTHQPIVNNLLRRQFSHLLSILFLNHRFQ